MEEAVLLAEEAVLQATNCPRGVLIAGLYSVQCNTTENVITNPEEFCHPQSFKIDLLADS